MLEQEKNNNYLEKLRDDDHHYNQSGQSLYGYSGIVIYGPALKSRQIKLNNAVRRSFNTKTKMKVFEYNDAGEKEAFMTPLDSIKYHRNFLRQECWQLILPTDISKHGLEV